MTTDRLDGAPMRERLARLRAAIDAAPDPAADPGRPPAGGAEPSAPAPATAEPAGMSGPLVLAIESSCDETGVALVEDGRRIHANVVASQVALHAATGGIVPEVAARAHLRWIVPVLDAAWADAGVGWSDVDADRRDLRAGAGRIAPRRGQLRQGARPRPRQAARRGQPPRGPRRGGLAARPGRGPGRPARAAVPARRPRRVGRPHVPRRDARPRRLPPARPDRRRCRRRGVRQGRAGCSGSAIPGGPAIQAAAEGATRRDVRFPRAWLGDSYDFSFSGLKTAARRIVAAARADEGLPADDATAAARRRPVAELAWGFQDAVVDVLATKTTARPSARRVPGRSSSAAAWPRTRRSGPGSRATPPSSACRSSSRGPACAPTTAR